MRIEKRLITKQYLETQFVLLSFFSITYQTNEFYKVIRRYCSICKHTTAHDPVTRTCTKDHSELASTRSKVRDTRTQKSKRQASTTKKIDPTKRVVKYCDTCGRNTYHNQQPLKCMHFHKHDIQVAIQKVIPTSESKPEVTPSPLPSVPKKPKKQTVVATAQPKPKKVKRKPFEHKFHYITWNSKAGGYQLKLKHNSKELQPFFLRIEDALVARTKYFKRTSHRAIGIRLREITFTNNVRKKFRRDPSGNLATEYQFNRYILDDRKYSPITRRNKEAIKEVFEAHARHFNAVVKIYNRLREERFIFELEMEELELKPYMDLYYDEYAWEEAVRQYKEQLSNN